MDMVGLSRYLFKIVMLLANILIGTSRLCRNGNFAVIIQTPSNTHIMGKIYIEMFLYNNMVDCYVKKWLKVTAKVSG